MTTTWALQHINSGCWLAHDPSEPGGRGWSPYPADAITAHDPILFAARIRGTIHPATRSTCRLVPLPSNG